MAQRVSDSVGPVQYFNKIEYLDFKGKETQLYLPFLSGLRFFTFSLTDGFLWRWSLCPVCYHRALDSCLLCLFDISVGSPEI